MLCFFASDLHGHQHRYDTLFDRIEKERPAAVFLGGDLLPSHARSAEGRYPAARDFISDYLAMHLDTLHRKLGEDYPRIFLILGNDDPRLHEAKLLEARHAALWSYMHDRHVCWEGHDIFGYAHVPPTPFRLKDWERYDVSRYVDPGCISPEDGRHSVPVDMRELRYGSIQDDLVRLTKDVSLTRAIVLFHSPPYQTKLDRAALDGKSIDHAPLDVHVGSVAIRRFIERTQPLITLHGHIHESARLTGSWQQQLGSTYCYSGAHDRAELALIRFDPTSPGDATRELL